MRRLSCFFFFSSRRRHTRFDCDWSSDVCSSDLAQAAAGAAQAACQDVSRSQLLPNLCGGHLLVPVREHSRRSEEHTSELQSQSNLVCRLLLEKKKHALSEFYT